MAIPFLSSIDLTQNQALRLVLHNATSDPAGVEGQIYYNTSTNIVKTYDGSNWSSIAGDITGLIAGDGIDILNPNGPEPTISTDLKANGGLVIESTELAVDLAASSITGSLPVGKISGILPVANGGTGIDTFASNAILTGNGTSAIQAETTLTYDGTTLTQANATPHFVMTDTSTNADVRLSANSTAGSFSISADFNNEANTTKIHMICDGDEVGHFRGNNAYVGSFRLFPEKNNEAEQGIFFGTVAAGTFDPANDWTYARVMSFSSGSLLHIYPTTNTAAAAVPLAIGSDGQIMGTSIKDQDTMSSNSATHLATQQSIKAYVDAQVTAQDLDVAGDSGTGDIDLDSETFTIAGTANEIETSMSGTTLTVGLPTNVTIAGALTVVGKTTTNEVETISTSNGVQFEGTAADGNDAILKSVVAGASITYTLPNVAGYVALFATDPGTTAIVPTVTELNYVDGVTSAIQTQLNAKQPLDADLTALSGMQSGAATAVGLLTSTEVAILDGATLSTTELNYVDGVTSAIQTQLDTKRTAAQVTTAINGNSWVGEYTANGSTTYFDAAHNLGMDVIIQIYDSLSSSGTYGATVYADIDRDQNSGDTARISFASAPTNGQKYKVMVTKVVA